MRLFEVRRAQRSKFTERRERLQKQKLVESEADSDTKPLDRRTPRLPAQHTRFFGREEEISQLMEMLSPAGETDSAERIAAQRLVTLLGPGGSGKTRLATQVAGKLVDAFDGAVYFVPLADVVEEHGIAEATMSALGIQPQHSRKPLVQIAGHLGDGPALLVLDNMEQLPGCGSQFVNELLAKVPDVVCLATSRKVIGLDGEREYQVQPLPVPTMPGTPDRLIEFASVQMFVDRAQNVLPAFQVTERNADALAAVCEKLEGIPLAIELAAARVKALTPAQILTQLDDRFGFLVSRNSNRDTRHQTLRAAFDWSFDLLSEELRRFLAVLSVFRGGWSLEAARAITADPDALEVLEQLIERSLVIAREIGDEMCYQMLESLREYASEKLSEKARSMALLRHAQFFGRVAEEAEPKLRWSDADEWIERLDADRLNLMSALAFTKGEEDGLRLAGALWRFWYLRGYHHEGLEQLETALAAFPAGTPEARAKANLGLGVLAQHQGDPGHADALLQSSLELAQEAGDAFLTGEALHNLALLAVQRGDRGQARELSERALEQRYAINDRWGAAATLCTLGSIEQGLGNASGAEKYYRESRRIYEEIGDDRQSALVLNNLGTLSLENGDLAEARLSHELSLSLFRQQKNRWAVAAALNNLGEVALGQGDPERAVDLFRQSLRQLYELGDKAAAVNPLAGLGIVARKGGDPVRAARLLGASHALRAAQDAALSQAGQAQFDAEVGEVRDDLSPADFKAAWDYGSALSWKKIVAYGLEQESRIIDSAPMQILAKMS
jgi:predicted ATPase/Tfp pilus assembly protein PilF